MLRYGLASQFWRAIPVWGADRAWERRGQRLLSRAARSVPAYASLLHAFSPQSPQAADGAEFPSGYLRTSWKSYVDVFPPEERGRLSWQREVISFDPLSVNHGTDDSWPRSGDELQVLREQLAGILHTWFGGWQRRVLLLVSLPATGWSAGPRIGQALHEAIALGQVRGSVVDLSGDPEELRHTAIRHGQSFDQCVVLCEAGEVSRQVRQVQGLAGRFGAIVFGPVPSGEREKLPADFPICSVWGVDEVGPLTAMETPFSRLVTDICQVHLEFRHSIWSGSGEVMGLYQPLPMGPWIEQYKSELVVSNWGALPVMRYRTGCRGGMAGFGEICQLLRRHEVQPMRQIRRLIRMGSVCWKLPLLILASA